MRQTCEFGTASNEGNDVDMMFGDFLHDWQFVDKRTNIRFIRTR